MDQPLAVGVDIGLRVSAIANNRGRYSAIDLDLKGTKYDDILFTMQNWLDQTKGIWLHAEIAGVEHSDKHGLVKVNSADALRMQYIEGVMVGLLRGDCCIPTVHFVPASTYKAALKITSAPTRHKRKKISEHWAMNHYFLEPPEPGRVHDIADAAMIATYLTRFATGE